MIIRIAIAALGLYLISKRKKTNTTTGGGTSGGGKYSTTGSDTAAPTGGGATSTGGGATSTGSGAAPSRYQSIDVVAQDGEVFELVLDKQTNTHYLAQGDNIAIDQKGPNGSVSFFRSADNVEYGVAYPANKSITIYEA
jgi:hypothetical protein